MMRTLLFIGLLLPAAVVVFIGCAPAESDPVAITTPFGYTASGDDAMTGQASQVQIRMALTGDSLLSNWIDCQIAADTIPWPPGVDDTLQTSFTAETGVVYYFMAKVSDEVGNWSDPGNIISRIFTDTIKPFPITDLYFAD